MNVERIFIKTFGVLFMAALLFSVLPVGEAMAQTTYCVNVGGTEGCFPSIQEAIDVAVDGDTIEVYPGTYIEGTGGEKALDLTVPNLTVRSTDGRDATIIDANGATTGVWVNKNLGTVTFDGFTVKNFTDNGVVQSYTQREGTAFYILNNLIDPSNGYLRNGLQVSGSNSQVKDNIVYGAPLTDEWASTGIGVINASNVIVSGNLVQQDILEATNPDIGINVMSYNATSNDVAVKNNTVQNAGNGIRISAGNPSYVVQNVIIENNILKDNNKGINVQNVTLNDVTISNNTIQKNRDEMNGEEIEFGTGIRFSDESATATGITISGNTFEDNETYQVFGHAGAQISVADVLANNTFDNAVTINSEYVIYSAIQTAVDAAADGATINVLPGTYNEQLELRTPNITVQSTDGRDVTFLDVPDGNLTTGVKVLADMGSVTFDGFTVMDFTEGGIIQGMSARPGTSFHVLNNKVIPAADYLRNGIQVSGDGSTVKGNFIEGAYLTEDWASTAIGVVNASNVLVEANEISGAVNGVDFGISVYNWNVDSVQNVSVINNTIYNVDYPLDATAYHGTVSNVVMEFNKITNYVEALWAEPYNEGGYDGISVTNVDASPNWWGSIAGPQSEIFGEDVTYSPWCGDEACSFTVPDENGVITLSGNVNVPGGIVINEPGLTFLLADDTVIQNDSPCFVINADNTRITTESPLGAVCLPTDGSNAIDVDGGLTNIIIEGLEIDGATGPGGGTDGILLGGIVTDLVIRDNFIHDLPGAGLNINGQPAGTVQIQGNLFKDNAFGINANGNTVLAEYNAWGSYDGPVGDDISAGVDADPWTHVDLYLESSGTDYANKVIQGETITYTVKANLANVMAADFVLDYPSELSVDGTPVMGSLFDNETLTDDGNQLHFMGYQFGSAALNEADVVLFTVTIRGDSLGKSLALELVNAPDSFGMAPGTGPSTTIYAAALDDVADLEVNALPTMDIDPEPGDVVAGLPVEFTVEIANAGGSDYDNLALHLDVPTDAILQVWDGAAWVAYVDPFDVGSLAAEGTTSPLFRVAFFSSGSNSVAAELYDTIAASMRMVAFDSEGFVTLGDFDVTGTISMQGRSVRSDVPLALTTLTEPDYGVFNTISVDLISNNYTFSGVNGGDYEFTTNQPRYLNVTADLDKQFSVVSGSVSLETLELKGGNANWADNVIDIGDAGIVAGEYQQPLFDNGDVNFDGRVNIQDLALVGGNYNLTSADAYAGWVPLVP
ncbi:right-handed parallel beta-helix repeat-containing protein [bacterium]|nr:right-handed parallel beta-helix repeat-containing protein [bacterium]